MRRNNFCWCTFLRERSPQSKLRGTDFHFLSFAYSDLIVGSWHVWEGSTKGSLGRELEATGCPRLPGSHHPLKEQGLMVTHLGKVEVPAARLGPGEFHTHRRGPGDRGERPWPFSRKAPLLFHTVIHSTRMHRTASELWLNCASERSCQGGSEIRMARGLERQGLGVGRRVYCLISNQHSPRGTGNMRCDKWQTTTFFLIWQNSSASV